MADCGWQDSETRKQINQDRETERLRAAAVVVVHNHPSGDPTPSVDDRDVTAQLVAAGKLLDIPVQDHVIIGRGRYLSFIEAGFLRTLPTGAAAPRDLP